LSIHDFVFYSSSCLLTINNDDEQKQKDDEEKAVIVDESKTTRAASVSLYLTALHSICVEGFLCTFLFNDPLFLGGSIWWFRRQLRAGRIAVPQYPQE
jgi:hypothetical protein